MNGIRLYPDGKIRLENLPEPQLRDKDDIKIRVRYGAINADDYNMYCGKLGTRYSNNGLVHEFSGEIVALGSIGRRLGFSVGDRVSANCLMPCGICPLCRSGHMNLCIETPNNGRLDEYIVLSSRRVVRLPDYLSWEEGALYWLAATCSRCVERIQPRAGESILIHGGGSAGLVLLQLLLRRMPSIVMVSEPVQSKRLLAKKLGATHVLDPNSENLTEKALELTNGLGFNVVIDAAGNPAVLPYTLSLLNRGGRLMMFSDYGVNERLELSPSDIYWKEATILSCYGAGSEPYTAVNADFMRGLDLRSLISNVFPIEQTERALKLFGTRLYTRILIKIP